ncbi:hypothetical protein JD844_002947 [Phrynosoma platyrhinos]|uniref:Glycolipid transfer protein domain-containing protein n=1 Tax=Phrynosoma platyrhinos TaxID=52577 RepID=A0ABQ7TDW7_PHRPL|nr:hypothetical protein JD844_002947 [Phrynosoma platyrhinos]
MTPQIFFNQVFRLTLSISVHPTDNTRVNLIIPGEQYFYLKSKNAADRQKWLVALGTAKACLTDIRTLKEKGKQSLYESCFHIVLVNFLKNKFTENTDALKTKMTELRLYCDLLIQQVDKTKVTALSNVSQAERLGNAGKINIFPISQNGVDMGTLLKSTCTTFLKTLEECMQIANAAFSSELLYQTPSGSPHSALQKLNKLKLPSLFSRGVAERQMELKNCENGSICANINLPEQTPVPLKTDEMDHEKNIAGGSKKDEKDKMLPKKDDQSNKPLEPVADSTNNSAPLGEETNTDLMTFFGAMSIRFSDIELSDDGGIPTEEFLQSCYEIVPVLDKLGSTKINQKYITSKDDFNTLQKIILHEVSTGDAQIRHSATEALLWLKRGLKFLKEFLTELKNGEKNIQTALNNAYGRTLRQYHGWVVRGVFALALRASPTYEGFALALSVGECGYQEEAFYNSMQRDLDIYLPAMEKQLNILDALYEEHGLESDEVV